MLIDDKKPIHNSSFLFYVKWIFQLLLLLYFMNNHSISSSKIEKEWMSNWIFFRCLFIWFEIWFLFSAIPWTVGWRFVCLFNFVVIFYGFEIWSVQKHVHISYSNDSVCFNLFIHFSKRKRKIWNSTNYFVLLPTYASKFYYIYTTHIVIKNSSPFESAFIELVLWHVLAGILKFYIHTNSIYTNEKWQSSNIYCIESCDSNWMHIQNIIWKIFQYYMNHTHIKYISKNFILFKLGG